jgi:hypothetical protein
MGNFASRLSQDIGENGSTSYPLRNLELTVDLLKKDYKNVDLKTAEAFLKNRRKQLASGQVQLPNSLELKYEASRKLWQKPILW